MKNVAFEAFAYWEFGVCVLGFLPIMGVSHALHRGDPTQRKPGRWMRRLGRLTSQLNPLWQFTVEGKAPADIATRPYVVVSNHESMADPFLIAHLPWDMRWIAKEELYRIPIVGQAFAWSGDIALRRGHGDSVRAVMAECREALDAGISIMIFPEGTRSKDGDLLPFKDGAFRLAIEAQVPILPLALTGTRDCLAKGQTRIGAANARLRILEPISTSGLGDADIATLRDSTRETISAAVTSMRGLASERRSSQSSARPTSDAPPPVQRAL
ncbi:MAG: lysophospholipid acyltransferase family protein [Polyangiaceae bacterium]